MSLNQNDHRNYGSLPDGIVYKCPSDCGCNELVYWFFNEARNQYYTRCKKWIGGHWIDPPGLDPRKPNAKRSKPHLGLVKKFSEGFCEICLVTEVELHKIGQHLEAHHIIPFEFTADSRRENIQIVCRSCHSLINHQRTYRKHLGQWNPTNPPASSTSSSSD
jgi:hypothetical protein